ncbi:MAG: hypothetical protein IJG49_08205 [Erysipelotrichaceae bacterium]|nr:hypothetical protein [Erysipelotrichaceae bacterium]
MRILAIDFETANNSFCSACSIGYCLWDQGEIIRKGEILIKPHPRYGYFSAHNTAIHGLHKSDCDCAESWPYVFSDIYPLFDDSIIAAHNAMFDLKVLKSINELYGIEMDDFPYLDTVYLSRKMFPRLPNHRLNTVCEYLGFRFNHHQAGQDAFGCMAIIEAVMEMLDEYDIEKLLQKTSIRLKKFSDIV